MQLPQLDPLISTRLSKEERHLIQIEMHTSRFAAYANEDKQKLAELLQKLSFFVGLKEPLSQEEVKLLVMFLHKQFPHCTKEKLEDAFMQFAAGDLGEINHFGQFSSVFVAKVIKAYERTSKAALMKYQRLQDERAAQEKAQQEAQLYDPIMGAVLALQREREKHRKKNLDEFNDFDNVQSKWTIEICQKVGILKKYDPNEITEKRYLQNFFAWLLKNAKDENLAIERYVKTNAVKPICNNTDDKL
jgi:hypothetical protein